LIDRIIASCLESWQSTYPAHANPGLEWVTKEKTKAAGGARGWFDLLGF
jgi:hypothetical protein